MFAPSAQYHAKRKEKSICMERIIKHTRNNSMTKYIVIIISTLIFFINWDCKKNPVGPENIQPGRRDYTWTVDTLTVPNGDLFYLFSLWGSSPTDIWAVGSGSTRL